jgi:LysM repeat protein
MMDNRRRIKGVQGLINRRKARTAQYAFAVVAGLVLLAILLLIINFFTGGIRLAFLDTATPTASPTLPATATPSPNPGTPTPQFSPTPTDTEGPSPTPTPLSYTVQEGDTLFGISIQFGVSIAAIRQANNLPSEVINPGTILIIPQGNEFPTATPTPFPTPLEAMRRAQTIEYTVLLGDTLEIIAAKFLSTAADIAAQNSNVTNANLQAGQVLRVRVNLVTPTFTPVPTRTP